MRVVKWHSSLETGNPVIDEQHRALYVLVNDLNADSLLGNDRATASRALDRILHYATTHFSTEEELMAQTSYPAAERHIALHRQFGQEVIEMVAAHEAGHGKSVRELAAFMEGWFEAHIVAEDQPLIDHVRARRSP